MRFHQVKELVTWAVDFHRQLAGQYQRLADEASNERQKMALEYLVQRETKQGQELASYLEENGDHTAVLETWFDDPADFPHAPVLGRLPERLDGGEVQDVLATALATHRTLQDLYEHRAERAGAPREGEFFASLAAEHKAEVRRIVRDLQRLEAY
ncbi:2-hydroxyacyl-CoA dehydratase [Halomonas salifodinae]|uniref:2-hydroxyacyl-CoA dehydratase n=1 Tax=Halomonas salifodinae TaxID=438745 RepID=UPI0033B5DCED